MSSKIGKTAASLASRSRPARGAQGQLRWLERTVLLLAEHVLSEQEDFLLRAKLIGALAVLKAGDAGKALQKEITNGT